jgi:hypothetical protein
MEVFYMKKFFCYLLICFLGISTISSAQPWGPHKSFDPNALAIGFLDALVKEDYAGAATNFAPKLKKTLTLENLKASWKCLTSQAGKFKKNIKTRTEKLQHYHIVIIRCEFELYQAEMRIVFNRYGKIAGFTIAPIKPYSESSRLSVETTGNRT